MLRAMGSRITKKVAETVAKVGFAVHETHYIIHLAQELFYHPDSTLKMMSQEAYDSICARIDRDLVKLETDEKDYHQKITDYKTRQEKDNLTKKSKKYERLNIDIKNKFVTWINEYRIIAEELKDKQKKFSTPRNYIRR
ncbi:MAG: hypothetical protein Q8889_02505 [Candidatus Phytoplasma australasiaticum]|nr:hypothetical protein [Candidatus Phytoplasma australasiaticum]MDV3199973.1 hypothetical protein [Candidatus Phytoplasma australasiaticum]